VEMQATLASHTQMLKELQKTHLHAVGKAMPSKQNTKYVREVIRELYGKSDTKFDVKSTFRSQHNRKLTATLRGDLEAKWSKLLPAEVDQRIYPTKALDAMFKDWYVALLRLIRVYVDSFS
jgi:hypothetical protein